MDDFFIVDVGDSIPSPTSSVAVKAAKPKQEFARQQFPDGILFQLGNEVARTEQEVIAIAVRYLAGVCDGAARRDNVGYNRFHAGFGHGMAETPLNLWTPKQTWAARKMLETYKNRQLAFMWPYMPPLAPEPPIPPAEQARQDSYVAWKRKSDPTYEAPKVYRELTLMQKNGQFVVKLSQNYDQDLIAQIKRIPMRKFEPGTANDPEKYWYVPLQLEALEPLLDFATRNGYDVPEDIANAIETVVKEYAETVALSRAASTDFEMELPDGLSLFPFQKAGVQYATRVGNVLIADEMGLGKTVQALATVKLSDAFPMIVICPASLKRNWEREAKKWLPGKRVSVIQGGGTYPLKAMNGDRMADIVIINYNSRVLEKWLMNLIDFGAKAFVLDEAHNVKNEKAAQTKLVEKLIANTPDARRILLSGTPVVNRPVEFWTLIKMLGRAKEMGGFSEYMARYDTTRRERLEELNVRARTHFMIRRLKKDVLPELPAKLRSIVPIEIDNEREYTVAERDIAGYFAKRKSEDAEFIKQIEGYADAKGLEGIHRQAFIIEAKKQHFSAQYMIAAQAEQLLRWEALKQLAVKGKMKGVYAWIDEFLEDGDQKIVIFGDHTAVIEGIASRYNAPYIHGGVSVDKRMPIVDRFQNDPATRVIVGNMKAMGEGLTLTSASNVAFVEFGWNPKTHDQAEDRCHRIGQHDTVNVWNLAGILSEGTPTIDYELAEMIDRKRIIVDAIQDGADEATQITMMNELQERLNARLRGGR